MTSIRTGSGNATARTGATSARQATVVRLRPSPRERLAGAAATLAIAVIVTGVPVALVMVFGNPVPSKLPGQDVLTAPVSTGTILAVVAALVWLAWLHFVVCLAVETVSAVRAKGLPRPVPLGAASQPLARRLVITAMLLLAAAGAFDRDSGGGGGGAEPRIRPSVSAAPPVLAEENLAAERAAQRSAERHTDLASPPAQARVPAVAYDGEFLPGTKIYTVQPPKGRYHDNLWDIAERHLGAGRRYREIFELNKGRDQPTGGRLQLARLIHPGWVLVMPPDATGVDVAPAPQPPVPPDQTAPDQTAPDQTAPEPLAARPDAAGTGDRLPEHFDESGLSTAPAEQSSAAEAGASAAPAEDDGVSGRELLAAGLLAAGLLSGLSTLRELQRRRRPHGAQLPIPDPDAADVEVTMRLAADPDGSAALDRALRVLAAQCAQSGRAFPEVFAVRLTPSQIELLMAALPADPPPEPFFVTPDGRWAADREAVLTRAGVDEQPLAAVRPPLPGLVGIGRDVDHDDIHVLIDLEAARGLVGVSGEPQLVREFLTAAAAELATNGWSGRVAVTCVGLDDGLADLAPGRSQLAPTLDEALDQLEDRRPATADQPGIESVFTGRLGGRRGDLFVPDYLVVGVPPTPAQAERMAALAGGGHLARVGVLTSGPAPGLRWRIELADTAKVPMLDLEVTPQLLTHDTLRRVAALATTAGREPDPPTTPWAAPPTEPKRVHLRSVSEQPVVEVRVLGPLEVAGITLDEARRSARTEELATFLALHHDRVSRERLVASLWPGGATDESVTAALRRTRDWLGADPYTHQPLLSGGDDGPWRLSGPVRLDWAEFQTLVLRGQHDDLSQALALVRGSLLAGRPRGRYAWLARMTVEYDVPVLVADTAHRVARVALLRGEIEAAASAARTGLGLDRDCLPLWRDLLDAEGRRDPEAARRVAEIVRDRFGRRVDPATRAVVARVLGEEAGGEAAG